MKELYQSLLDLSESSFYPYHMPGHKRVSIGNDLDRAYALDITEIDDFDNLHGPTGIILEAEKRASKLYHAKETYFLVNGSTSGILSAISAVVKPGGHILMARNSHKAAYHAVYLRNLKVTYLYPEYDSYGIAYGIKEEDVKEALEKDSTIEAVFLTSPTYEGRVSSVSEIAKIVHEKGIPLVVDEAHGAHFGMHPKWPSNSNQCGADLVIHSTHKTLPCMTQTALLHKNGNLVDSNLLRRFMRIYQTSSPSYVLMASIEEGLKQISEKNFHIFYERYTRLVKDLKACKNIQVVPTEDFGKLILSTRGTNITGQELYDIFREKYQLQLEMSASDYALAMFTIGDTLEGFSRMKEAVLKIDATLYKVEINENIQSFSRYNENSLRIKEAWDAEMETIDFRESLGRRVGDFINLYPPGVPLLVPGEVIRNSDIELLESYLKKHLTIQGLFMKNNKLEITVIKNK